jgi:hypothetical protein
MDDRRSMLVFFGVLVAFKIWTVILILTLVTSWSTLAFLAATHVLWLALGAFLLWAPFLFWSRLVRVRAKRRKLQHAEWNVETTEASRR